MSRPSPQQSSDALTKEQAALILSCNASLLPELRAVGLGPKYFSRNGQAYYQREALMHWLKNQRGAFT